MSKIFGLFILGVFTLTSTELIQFTKLPSLVEHFAEHREQKSDLSLYEFIALHYSDESHHHDDTDKELPFKSHDHCVNSSIVYVLTNSITEVTIRPEFESIKEFSIPKGCFISSNHISSIWQPPKFS